jgi:hypothetical protein
MEENEGYPMDENQLDYEDQGLMCTAMHDEQEVR